MIFKAYSVAALAAVALLVGCGGDSDGDSGSGNGYSGNSSRATVDASNQADFAATALIGSSRAIEIEVGSDALPAISLSAARTTIRDLPLGASEIESLANERAVASGTFTDEICTTGSVTYNINTDDNTDAGTISFNYNNCTFSEDGESVSIDGFLYIENNADGSFYWDYDFTYSSGGETYTLNATLYCDASFSCGYEENFSEGGISYRVSDVSVSGGSSFGYDVTATVFHEEYGYVEIEATDLLVCDGGGFSDGTIEVTDSSGDVVLEVVFLDDCETMTYSFDGGEAITASY